MNKILRAIRVVAAALALGSPIAHAELPLTVEDLVTDKGKLKLDLSLTYANRDQQGVSTGDPIAIQTGETSFVVLPTLVSESLGNSDSLVGTVGLRYGVTKAAEAYFRTTYLYTSTRISDVYGIRTESASRLADTWAGINYEFKKDNDTPALLGFGELALRERHQYDSSALKSEMIGLTSYKAIDPVVFSLTTAYRFNQTRKDGALAYKPGNFLLLSPSVAFAVNDRVTLTGGVQWTNRQPDKWDNQTVGFRRTSSDLLLGVGYGVSKKSILNFSLKSNVSGSSGADLRLNWLRTF